MAIHLSWNRRLLVCQRLLERSSIIFLSLEFEPLAEIDHFYIKERILKFCEYQMFDADISELIRYAKGKGFLNRDESVTTEGIKLAHSMNKSDTWIPLEWQMIW